MKKLFKTLLGCVCALSATAQSSFTPGNLVVLQTTGTVSKGSSAATLKEYSTAGVAGMSVTLPVTGPTPYQTAGVYGGSEGFLTTSSDGKYLALAGYATAASFVDITSTLSASVTRAVGLIYPSGFYLQTDTSNTFFSANDIRVAVSDGTNFWAGGASNAALDGIDYFVPGLHTALATGTTPPKAYGMRIFNGNLYFSTQKSGPSNSSSQLGIFQLGTGLPTNGTPTVTQIINTGTVVPLDFSFNATNDICYIAINLNTSAGGIQKWTRSGTTWTLAYTLGTGITNTGAYGLVVDYSGTNPVIYATTFDAAGNRIIKITDAGSGSTATNLVTATAGVYFKGIAFAPVASGTPMVNISVSSDTSSEAAKSVITVTANTSAPVATAQTISLGVSGTGITSGDYTLSSNTITIPAGATSGSVTFTIVDDILGEGTEKATLTLSSPSSGIVPGKRVAQTITIFDNDGNNHPTIAMNTTATTDYIDGGVTVAPLSPFKLSGVINDPTDPGKTLGVTFKVHDLETPDTSLVTWVTSSNIAVVTAANVTIAGTDSTRIVKITPTGFGYSNITVYVTDGIDTTSYIINYAASAASSTPSSTFWHTGMSDASDGVPIDNNYFISGDDELNVLNVYSRSASGLPLVSFNYTSFLSLPDPTKPEVDLECSAVSPVTANKVYWMGSMSNTKSPFNIAPNRDRIFATTYSGTGASTAFAFGGYAALRTSIVSWGDANGYNFTASAASGVDSKSPAGFAAEGMVFGPDNTTLYIGMRTPLVPTTARTKAVIVPITNFETWFNAGAPSGSPVFGAPIELNMGGRGVRDMIRLSNGTYVILAGDPGGAMTSAIYTWTGYAKDAPNIVPSSASGVLNMEGVMQMNTGTTLNITALQIITDNGDDVFYGDGTAAKDFGDLIYRKFSSNIISSIDLTFPEINLQGNSVNINDGDTTISTADNTDFGNVAYATTITKTFTIQNVGTKTLSVSGINFTGANTGDFSLIGAPAFPLNIAASGSQVITVQFAPQALGFRKATINIISNDADEATYDIALRGNGTCNAITVDTVKGGGDICVGAAGLPVSMNISRTGLSYQLYNGASPVGTPKAGTGSALSFGIQATAGTYTAIATSTVTNCTQAMAGSAVINVNQLPRIDTVSGSGSYCSGGTGIAVNISGTQTNVDYQLYTGGTATGIIKHGNGGAGSFGNVTGAGSYIAIANNTVTGCTDTMYGTAIIGVYALPTILSTTGNTTCAKTNSSVTASPSSGAVVRWYNVSSSGSVLVTGNTLNITNPSATAIYYAEAYNSITGCVSSSRATATLTVNLLPTVYNVTGSGNYCFGDTGIAVGLSGSQTNVDYQLYNSGTATGIIRHGNGSAASFGDITTAGSYIAIANNTITGCTDTMSGTSVIGVYTLPTILSSTGNITCAGTNSSLNTTPSSGAVVRWYNAISGGGVLATGNTLNITNPTLTATYYADAYNAATGCVSAARTADTLTVNQLPAIYHVIGGGRYCSGGAGRNIDLSGSDTGISYQLYNGIATSGSAISGTASTFSFGQRLAIGTYKAIATNKITGCVQKMADTAVISIDPLPMVDTLSGGGNYCAGGVGLPAVLSGSQTGVDYQLYLAGVATGSPVSGTGTAVSFGNLTAAGNYIAIAKNSARGCADTMYGGAAIGIYVLPAILSTTGNKTCAGTSSYVTALPSTGATTRWYTVPTSGTIVTTGNTLNVINPTLPITYYAEAYNTTTGCISASRSVTTLTVNPLPIAFNVTGGGHYCQNAKGSEVVLDSSQAGIFYELYDGTTPVSSPIAGTGHKISMGFEKTATTYSVWATNTTTMCGNVMNGAVPVTIDPVPVVYTLSGGGGYCAGGTGKTISLSGSDMGISYQLYNGTIIDGTAVKGTSAPYSYSARTAAGNYMVVATDTLTRCADTMSGVATIVVTPVVNPAVSIIPSTSDTVCGGTSVTYTTGITHGGVTPVFQWKVNGTVVATTSAYSYSPANRDKVAVSMTSVEACATPVSVNDSVIMAVIDNRTPSITASATDSVVCDGTVVTLASTTLFGGNHPVYNWFVNGLSTSTASTFRYTPANGDIVYGQLISDYRCLISPLPVYSNTIHMSVTAPLIPTVSITAEPGTTIKQGQADTFMVTTTNTTSPVYQWYKGAGMIVGANTPTYIATGLSNGDSISCIVTNTDVCALSSFNSLKVYTINTGVATTAIATNMNILPNPSNGIFSIKGNMATNTDAAINLEVTNMAGQVVYQRIAATRNGVIDEQVNLGGIIASGTYLLRVTSGDESETFHIIVNR